MSLIARGTQADRKPQDYMPEMMYIRQNIDVLQLDAVLGRSQRLLSHRKRADSEVVLMILIASYSSRESHPASLHLEAVFRIGGRGVLQPGICVLTATTIETRS